MIMKNIFSGESPQLRLASIEEKCKKSERFWAVPHETIDMCNKNSTPKPPFKGTVSNKHSNWKL
jgi:hypothetical protein